MNKYNKGFTLIELMVVISIIGTLSSVVLAQVHDATGKARDAVRSQEIKQIVLGLNEYKLDHGTFPGADIGLQQGRGLSNYCLGLNDGQGCWEFTHNQAPPDSCSHTDLNPYSAACGSTALNNALSKYIPNISKDPLGTPAYGDRYVYVSENNPPAHVLGWAIETCSPDVVPPLATSTEYPNGNDGLVTSATSTVSCLGGQIYNQYLSQQFGYGCYWLCALNLDQ